MLTLIIIFMVLGALTKSNKKNKKNYRRRRNWYSGKSDWERTCDDGGKFFRW